MSLVKSDSDRILWGTEGGTDISLISVRYYGDLSLCRVTDFGSWLSES
jgi:hypothetical protein